MSYEVLAVALFSLIVSVLGYLGARMMQKLDECVFMLHDVSQKLRADIWNVSDTTHELINKLDLRVLTIETKCGLHLHHRATDVKPVIKLEELEGL